MRKYILQEKSFTPEAKCSDCATRSCKSCQILKNHKSYAAYLAYQRMYKDMKTIQINGKVKVECSYIYRAPINERFAPANSNREQALTATNSVIQGLIRFGKLEEFDLQMNEMEKMGTTERLSDEEVKELKHKVHHFNKLNFTTSSTSSSTPLRVLRDSTSKVPNTGEIFFVISQVAGGIDIGDGLTCIINHRIGQYAASLDIRKAYKQIRVSNRDAMLRLSI